MKGLFSRIGKFFIFFLVAFAIYFSLERVIKASYSDSAIVSRLNRAISKIELQHQRAMNLLQVQSDSLPEHSSSLDFSSITDGITIMAFWDDSLVYWNSNNINPELLVPLTLRHDTIANFGSGDFYTSEYKANDSLKIFLLTQLTTTYKIQNQYFKDVSLLFPFLKGNIGSFDSVGDNSYPIVSSDGSILATWSSDIGHDVGQGFTYLLLILFCILLLMLYLLEFNLIQSFTYFQNRVLAKCALFLVISIFSTYLLNLICAGQCLFLSKLFTTYCVHTSVFPAFSAGLLTEITLLFAINLLVVSNLLHDKRSDLKMIWNILIVSFLFSFLFLFYLHVIKMLFLNVTDAFSILQLYNQTPFNYLIFILIGLFSVTLIILQHTLFRFFGPFTSKVLWIWAAFVIFFVGLFLTFSLQTYYGWLSLIVGVVLYFLLIDVRLQERLSDIVAILLQIMLFTIILTQFLNEANLSKENEEMKSTASKLLDERDPYFETSYAEFQKKAAKDVAFQKMASVDSEDIEDRILDYVQTNLFDSVMNGYNVTLTLCAPGEDLVIQPEGFITGCDGYFANIIALNEGKEVEDKLYYIDYNSLDPNYLSMMKIGNADSVASKTAYFEYYKSIAPEGIGYPKLLRDNKSPIPANYSVACYKNNVLVYKYGGYIYPNFLIDMHYRPNDFYNGEKMKHYADCTDTSKVLIVTKNRHTWTDTIAPFSYFFFELLVIYLIFSFIVLQRAEKNPKQSSFRRKLQLFILLTLGISFLVIGPVSVLYMRSLYNKKNRDFHFERTRTVLLEMYNDVNFEQLLESRNEVEINSVLQHFNRTFFTDINLYGVDGRLIATTRSEVFDKNLQAKIMNADAFRNMHNERSLYYTHNESLGQGNYQSAYMNLLDRHGKTLAYLNMPYFSGEEELKSEISSYVMTYINIILFFMGFSALILLWLSKRMTKPLALIQNKMREVKIDQNNEPIEWKSKDEIGELITQYNQLIKELEKSASLIARSERETAWRSMARQVAHEIKNPLTPMRLSVQYLQKAWDEKAPDIDERMLKTTNTLIEQIDTLSEIASAFSDYAKLPENKQENIDLSHLVKSVIDLYNTEPNISIDYLYHSDENFLYSGDKNNLSRAVGNILKNAIQAIGKKPDGKVTVSLEATKQKYVIRIADNGKGIKEAEKKMIFLPNFTTKSSGMGVGLSIVYNIVQSAGGNITFESEENIGTTFTIELPKNAVKKSE